MVVATFGISAFMHLREYYKALCIQLSLYLFVFVFAFDTQGIDLKVGGKSKKPKRTAPKSNGIYLKLLVKVPQINLFATKTITP